MPYSHTHDDDPTIGFNAVCRELGRTALRWGTDRKVCYLQLLIDECGFPPSLPDLLITRRRTASDAAPANQLVHQVTADSRWRRAPVIAWLEDFLPPANAGQVEARNRAAAADDMDNAAANLQLVHGGRA